MLALEEDYHNQISKITTLKCSKAAKVQMLSALLEELKSRAGEALTEPETKTITTVAS